MSAEVNQKPTISVQEALGMLHKGEVPPTLPIRDASVLVDVSGVIVEAVFNVGNKKQNG